MAKVEEENDNKKANCEAPLPHDWLPIQVPEDGGVAVSIERHCWEHLEGCGGTCTGSEVVLALDKLAGTYERVETTKQRKATRPVERRLETMRDLEIKHMRLLVTSPSTRPCPCRDGQPVRDANVTHTRARVLRRAGVGSVRIDTSQQVQGGAGDKREEGASLEVRRSAAGALPASPVGELPCRAVRMGTWS
jgi:hypothetical protein